MTKRNQVKRALASVLAVGALAAAVPATGLAGGGTTPPPTNAEPGGEGH